MTSLTFNSYKHFLKIFLIYWWIIGFKNDFVLEINLILKPRRKNDYGLILPDLKF